MNAMSFQSARNVRREMRSETGRIRGGKLYPAMCHVALGSESGIIQQSLSIETDPIPGRLISQIMAEAYMIFVPFQAVDAIKDPEAAYAGMTEVVREKLLAGTLFGVENEGEISKRSAVKPRSVGGAKKVNEGVRLAYNAAVNMLRQRAYFRATLVAHTNTAILPAIYAQTVLDKLQGVLDPDDRINGAVSFELPAMNLPVEGIRKVGTGTLAATGASVVVTADNVQLSSSGKGVQLDVVDGDTNISAIFSGAINSMSLKDFYNAETQDKMARYMDQMMRDNPQYGAEMVLRWAHGLSVDAGKTPFLLAERRVPLNRALAGATDTTGIETDVLRTDTGIKISMSVPVPKTELGGFIVTLFCIKPDEKLASQPHPILSDVIGGNNFVADTLALDPVPVTVRDLYSDCATLDETNVVMYTGLNALKRTYVDYGFSRQLDQGDVEEKTAVWQIDVPLSVNPDNVNYPDYLDHYIFPFGGTEIAPEEVATYTVESVQNTPTPMIFGPTPIEDVSVIDDENLFEEEV